MGFLAFLRPKIAYCEDLKGGLPLPPVPDVSEPPSTEELPALVQQAKDIDKQRSRLQNPGLYELLYNDVKRTLVADAYDGCRVEVSKPLSSNFAVSHTLWLGSKHFPSGFYQFGANVAMGGTPTDPNTLLISRITPAGQLEGRWHQRISDNISMRSSAVITSEVNGSHFVADFDYKGDDFTVSSKLSNGMLLGLSYLQCVTPHLSVGGEGFYHGQNHQSGLGYSAKYSTETWTGIASYNGGGQLQLHYLRSVSERVRLASEMAVNPFTRQSTASVGAEFILRQSKLLTVFDHTGKISSVLECKVAPAVTLTLCASAEQASDFSFGYGLQIGQ